MSGHLPAVSQILRKCLSGTEIGSGLFLRESTKFPVAYNVFYIFFKFFSSNHGSTKPVPVSIYRQPVFGINSQNLLCLCTISPTCMASVVILRDSVSRCVFRGYLLNVYRHC